MRSCASHDRIGLHTVCRSMTFPSCFLLPQVMRWVLVGGATATSGLFIMANLRAPVFENAGPKALPVYLTMGGLHLALGAQPGLCV